MRKFPTYPFDVPVQVAGVDMIASVQIHGYTPERPARGPTWDCGGTPPEPAEIEFEVHDFRVDHPLAKPVMVSVELDALLSESDVIREACLGEIERHSEPPDDGQPDEVQEWADFDPDC